MKRAAFRISRFLFLLVLASILLSSCRVLMGDPRKNCNHPKHGEYMMEQRQKNLQGKGIL